MTKEKTPNYTEEQESVILKRAVPELSYDEQTALVKELADEFGRTVPSVRSKMVKLGVYQKKEYATKTGVKPETKEAIVSDIATTLGVDADSSLAGLEKATKNCLILLRKTIMVAHQALFNADESAEEETPES